MDRQRRGAFLSGSFLRGAQRLHEGFLPGRHALEAYGSGGFRFGDMSHQGSILALPDGIHAWQVTRAEDITLEALALALAAAAGIDLLLVGTGPEPRALPVAARDGLRAAGLAHEVMATAAAARTYTVLAAEGRRVGAALIAVP